MNVTLSSSVKIEVIVKIEYFYSKTPKSEVIQNLKYVESQHGTASKNTGFMSKHWYVKILREIACRLCV